MAYKVTHIKTKGDDSFEFYDKGAVRGIKPSFTEESSTDSNGYYIKDDNGYITIKKITYSAATEDTLGLISVPSSIEKDGKEYTNDLILESGKVSFKDKIKKICIGDNIKVLPINSDDAVIIPKMTTDSLGVAMVHSSQSIKVDDNGYLYIQFTDGWTDITNEKTEINFNKLVEEGLLSLGDSYGN